MAEGQAGVTLPPAGTLTLGLAVPAAPAVAAMGLAATAAPAAPPAPPEPAQPVYTRYWLHGKGPAPAGNMPVAVHLSPGRVALALRRPGPGCCGARRRCASPWRAGHSPPAATWTSTSRPGWRSHRPARCATTCPRWATRTGTWLSAAPQAPIPGIISCTARIRDQLGQVLEDATAVLLGGPPLPPLDLPPDVLLPALQADQQAIAAELEVTVLTPAVRIRPGTAGELAVRLANRAASTVRGEAQLISPFGSWAALLSVDARFYHLPREGK